MSRRPFERDASYRYVAWPEPLAVAFGAMLARCRRMAGMSQRMLAERTQISQSVISRLERGLAIGMSTERLLRIANELWPMLPLAFCPHDHACPWPRPAGLKAGPDGGVGSGEARSPLSSSPIVQLD